jgi:hypothetical protein
MFGTWAPRGDQELEYGLVAERLPEAWFKQQLVPVIGLWRLLRERTGRGAAAGGGNLPFQRFQPSRVVGGDELWFIAHTR